MPKPKTRRSPHPIWIVVAAVVMAVVVQQVWFQFPDPPESLILYSIDGRDDDMRDKEPTSEEKFYGYPVLGKVDIKAPEKRKAIMTALNKGIAESEYGPADCFWPRHAIKVTENGKTSDYVICFECTAIYVYSGISREEKGTTRKPQLVLNKYLREANIPLTPGMADVEEE